MEEKKFINIEQLLQEKELLQEEYVKFFYQKRNSENKKELSRIEDQLNKINYLLINFKKSNFLNSLKEEEKSFEKLDHPKKQKLFYYGIHKKEVLDDIKKFPSSSVEERAFRLKISKYALEKAMTYWKLKNNPLTINKNI